MIFNDTRRIGAQEEASISSYPVVPNRKRSYRFLKRAFDILGSLIGLVVLSPLFLIVSIVIYIDDPGPVLFLQERNGIDGKVFRMLKFRSMRVNAAEQRFDLASQNELDGPAFKMSNDPRVTRVGRFIRKTSIDETPQLVNVLFGQMSIVGPRPLPTYETAELTQQQRRRMLVRPGLICYWQVSGRNDIPFEEWMRMDYQYINEASIWTDLKIICKAIPAVISGRGAE